MAVIKVPDDMYDWIRKIQAGFRFKYDKTVNQLQIILHLPHNEIQSKDYDKVIDDLYESITRDELEKNTNKKKDNGSSVSE